MGVRGGFVTVEGIDGAGKSSHLDFLRDRIAARGVEVLVTREPGGTPFGARLREAVLAEPTTVLAEALALFADRAAHVESSIEPALARGTWVLCDRFSDSTYAYQCGGGGVAREAVEALERLVHPGLQPDATFLFDIEPTLACERLRGRGAPQDRFEREQTAFFERVRAAYLERARDFPRRFHVIDASGTPDQVRVGLAHAFSRAFP